MKVHQINNSVYCNNEPVEIESEQAAAKAIMHNNPATQALNGLARDSVSFKGGNISASKRFWLFFRKLSDYMKEPSEMTNAQIAAIGTGGIAPFAIMCSPSKKTKTEEDKKAAREKKFFQAVRQPVSALLAFGFQVPTTIGIAAGLNHLAYEKKLKFFDDEILGQLIPSKKYLKKQAKKVLNGKADEKLLGEWQAEVSIPKKFNELKTELIEQLKQDYEEVGIEVSQDKLEKLAEKKKKKNAFIIDKMVASKRKRLIDAKISELSIGNVKIEDADLVTSDYQNLAKLRHKEEFKKLRQEANLSWFDKFIMSIGISNGKISKLDKAEKALAKEKGLEILRAESPEIFKNKMSKLRKFVENKDAAAQKLYGNKIFWLTLVTNLFMVAVSCIALNWLHPKFAEFVDGIKMAKAEKEASQQKKVEVAA